MRFVLALVLLLAIPAAHADPATERYAPAQLRVASDLLAEARAAAARGDPRRAAQLAWQAGFDARLAWGMTESEHLRAEAVEVAGAASALVTRLSARQ